MKQEIIDVIKKYIEIDEKEIDVRLTNKENEDGTNGAPALYANIPILNIKNDARKINKKDVENKKEDKEDNQEKEETKQEEKVEETEKIEQEKEVTTVESENETVEEQNEVKQESNEEQKEETVKEEVKSEN